MVRAYPLQTHEMLFDALAQAFRALGGVPQRGIFDNMKTAVDRIGRGKIRQVNARFAAMASHYLFETDFCNPPSGWERAFGAPLGQAQWRAVKLKRTYKTLVDAYGSQCPTSLILMP